MLRFGFDLAKVATLLLKVVAGSEDFPLDFTFLGFLGALGPLGAAAALFRGGAAAAAASFFFLPLFFFGSLSDALAIDFLERLSDGGLLDVEDLLGCALMKSRSRAGSMASLFLRLLPLPLGAAAFLPPLGVFRMDFLPAPLFPLPIGPRVLDTGVGGRGVGGRAALLLLMLLLILLTLLVLLLLLALETLEMEDLLLVGDMSTSNMAPDRDERADFPPLLVLLLLVLLRPLMDFLEVDRMLLLLLLALLLLLLLSLSAAAAISLGFAKFSSSTCGMLFSS